jgi:hypothetical protein
MAAKDIINFKSSSAICPLFQSGLSLFLRAKARKNKPFLDIFLTLILDYLLHL